MYTIPFEPPENLEPVLYEFWADLPDSPSYSSHFLKFPYHYYQLINC